MSRRPRGEFVRFGDNSPAARGAAIREQREQEQERAREMSKKERNDKGVVRRKPNAKYANAMIDELAHALNDGLDALAVARQRAEQIERGHQSQRLSDERRQRGGGPR